VRRRRLRHRRHDRGDTRVAEARIDATHEPVTAAVIVPPQGRISNGASVGVDRVIMDSRLLESL